MVIADFDAGAHARQPSVRLELLVVAEQPNRIPALGLGHGNHGADRRLRQAAAAPGGFDPVAGVCQPCAITQAEVQMAGVHLDPVELAPECPVVNLSQAPQAEAFALRIRPATGRAAPGDGDADLDLDITSGVASLA
nr:hypothetical protein [Dankookia rubra]